MEILRKFYHKVGEKAKEKGNENRFLRITGSLPSRCRCHAFLGFGSTCSSCSFVNSEMDRVNSSFEMSLIVVTSAAGQISD